MVEPEVKEALKRAGLPVSDATPLFHATNSAAAKEITETSLIKGGSTGQVWLASSKEIAALMHAGGITTTSDARKPEINVLLEVVVAAERLYWGETRTAEHNGLELFFLLDENEGCRVEVRAEEAWIPQIPAVYTEPWIYWLQAAEQQTAAARNWREISDKDLPIGEELLEAVLEELPAAMQAISSAAFAVDGFDGAVADLVALPKVSAPRPKQIVERLGSVVELQGGNVKDYEDELRWLFDTRNKSVHGAVWKDPAFRHRSGLSISAAQREFCLENAERALDIGRRFIASCLEGASANGELAEWAAMRLARCDDLLGRFDG